MSLVDELRQHRQTSQAIWLQFLTAYDSKCNDLYVFFEGSTDSAYYMYARIAAQMAQTRQSTFLYL